MWVQKGEASFIIDGDTFNLAANAFFIIPKSRIHQFIPNTEVNGQVIRFTEDELVDFPRLIFSKFNNISEISLNTLEREQFELLYKSIELEWNSPNKNDSFLTGLFSLVI